MNDVPKIETVKLPSADDWQLTQLPGEEWLLCSPLWSGEVRLTTTELLSPTEVRRAVLQQKQVLLPKWIAHSWIDPADGEESFLEWLLCTVRVLIAEGVER